MSFTIRVYGLLINGKNEILLSKEVFRGVHFTKFPGGGLEFGESTRACLEREFLEEFQVRVAVQEHFYTTDFFVQSAFDPSVQVVNIYYKVTTPANVVFPQKGADGQLIFWFPVKDLKEEMMTFPIEKKVVQLLLKETTTRKD